MDIDITCLEASEYLSDDIDGRLEPGLKAPLATHLERCRYCRLERTLLEGSRTALRSAMKPVATPEALRNRIVGGIRTAPVRASGGMAAHPAPFNFSNWRIPLAFAGALGLALIAFNLFLQKTPHNHTRPFDGSVVTESFNNFDRVVDGRMTPSIVSNRPGEVKAFLERNVNFPVQVPVMRDFRLVGGLFSDADNEKTAHVIYEREGNYVYISQTDARRLVNGKRRFIPKTALDEIQRSGWFFAGDENDCNLAMWIADSTLCTAVADINRQNLLMNIGGVAPR